MFRRLVGADCCAVLLSAGAGAGEVGGAVTGDESKSSSRSSEKSSSISTLAFFFNAIERIQSGLEGDSEKRLTNRGSV